MAGIRTIIKNGFIPGVGKRDIAIVDGRIAECAEIIEALADDRVIEAEGLVAAPAFVDVHVHLREPGYGYKERIATGTMAAAREDVRARRQMLVLQPSPQHR